MFNSIIENDLYNIYENVPNWVPRDDNSKCYSGANVQVKIYMSYKYRGVKDSQRTRKEKLFFTMPTFSLAPTLVWFQTDTKLIPYS